MRLTFCRDELVALGFGLGRDREARERKQVTSPWHSTPTHTPGMFFMHMGLRQTHAARRCWWPRPSTPPSPTRCSKWPSRPPSSRSQQRERDCYFIAGQPAPAPHLAHPEKSCQQPETPCIGVSKDGCYILPRCSFQNF
jgi:hypothetical protein